MNNISGTFWADPKIWVAILAVVISIINFIFLSQFRWDQNKRWDALNIARVELSEVYFIGWEEIDRQTAINRLWGYSPSVFSVVKNHVHTEKFLVLEELVLWDPIQNRKVTHSNGFHILSEAQLEMNRLGLAPQGTLVFKHMQLQVDLKNAGSTLAQDIQATLDILDDGTGMKKSIFKSTSTVELFSGSSINLNTDIWLPLTTALPRPTRFHLNLIFTDIHGEKHERTIPIDYDPERNYWIYGK